MNTATISLSPASAAADTARLAKGIAMGLLGPSRAAVFPALAPGLAALIAWPVLGHMPATLEAAGLLVAMAGLIIAVTASKPNQPTLWLRSRWRAGSFEGSSRATRQGRRP